MWISKKKCRVPSSSYTKLKANLMHYGASIAFGKIQQNATRAHLISVTSGGAGAGVTKPISPVSLFLRFFTIVDTLVAYWMSRPYLTGVKYEMDSYNLTGIFSKSKISLTDKLANGALVTSNPDRHNWSLSGHVTGACQRAEMKFGPGNNLMHFWDMHIHTRIICSR